VFNRILLHQPDDAFDKFEEISALVKQTDLKFKDPKFDFELNEPDPTREKTDADKWVEKCKKLIHEVRKMKLVLNASRSMGLSQLKRRSS
jgi:hypothetical protein